MGYVVRPYLKICCIYEVLCLLFVLKNCYIYEDLVLKSGSYKSLCTDKTSVSYLTPMSVITGSMLKRCYNDGQYRFFVVLFCFLGVKILICHH